MHWHIQDFKLAWEPEPGLSDTGPSIMMLDTPAHFLLQGLVLYQYFAGTYVAGASRVGSSWAEVQMTSTTQSTPPVHWYTLADPGQTGRPGQPELPVSLSLMADGRPGESTLNTTRSRCSPLADCRPQAPWHGTKEHAGDTR